MIERSRAWVLLAIAVTACTGKPSTDVPPEVVAASGLTELVVLWDVRGFDQGDTVFVDVASVSDDIEVDFYSGAQPAGKLPLEALGLAAPGTMIVNADRLNVRRCRSTGCSLVGYVERGQAIEVREYLGGWYRMMMNDEPLGYLYAHYLQLPRVYLIKTLWTFEQETADYFERRLADLTVDGGQRVFSHYEVYLEEALDLVSFDFFTPYKEGPGLQLACEAMRGIAEFVRGLMADVPREVFAAYSAGIYYGTTTEAMLAGLADEDIFCLPPD